MFFTPKWDSNLQRSEILQANFSANSVADLATYEEYFPDDISTVQVIGVDMYPKSSSGLTTAFTEAMQGFHDQYCSDSGPFCMLGTGRSEKRQSNFIPQLHLARPASGIVSF